MDAKVLVFATGAVSIISVACGGETTDHDAGPGQGVCTLDADGGTWNCPIALGLPTCWSTPTRDGICFVPPSPSNLGVCFVCDADGGGTEWNCEQNPHSDAGTWSNPLSQACTPP